MKASLVVLVGAMLAGPSLGLAELAGSGVTPTPLNLLYYGNSFTSAETSGGTRSVPSLVSDLAFLAGHPRPHTVNASVLGGSFFTHVNDNNTAVISAGVPTGQTWDFVVLQDHSLEPTRLGSLTNHLTKSLQLYNFVAAHSPEVNAVMFQTWARGPGHSLYTGTTPAFPGGPGQMHGELRSGYRQSTDQLNAVHGAGTGLLAPAGDAWAAAGFPLSFYAGDAYHANDRGSLVNALTLYATIYGDATVTDLPLSGLLSSLNISASNGNLIVASVQSLLASTTTSAIPEPSVVGIGLLICGGVAGAKGRRRSP